MAKLTTIIFDNTNPGNDANSPFQAIEKETQAETAKIQVISEERERLNAEYKAMQAQLQAKIDKKDSQNEELRAEIRELQGGKA